MIINYTAHGRTGKEIHWDAKQIGAKFFDGDDWVFVIGDCHAEETDVTVGVDGSAMTTVTLYEAHVSAGPEFELQKAGLAQ